MHDAVETPSYGCWYQLLAVSHDGGVPMAIPAASAQIIDGTRPNKQGKFFSLPEVWPTSLAHYTLPVLDMKTVKAWPAERLLKDSHDISEIKEYYSKTQLETKETTQLETKETKAHAPPPPTRHAGLVRQPSASKARMQQLEEDAQSRTKRK